MQSEISSGSERRLILMHKSHGLLLITSLLLPMLLFSFTAYNSYGYDDEMFNLNHIESYSSAYELVSEHLSGKFLDIHPLGSYLINYALIKIFGSWNIVRVFGAVIAALSVWLFWRYVVIAGVNDILTVIFAYVFMCLNPNLILWCTGVRWYTYFFPLVCIMGTLFSPSKFIGTCKNRFWGIYFITASLMFYIESNAAIMILVSFILLLFQRRKNLRNEFRVILCFGLLSVLFVSRQIYLCLTVLYPAAKSGEVYSFMASFIGGGHHFLLSHAVMPLSIPGLLLIIANTILFLTFIMNIKAVSSSYTNGFFMLSYAGMILSGIGGKIRNYVSLSAVHGNFLADTFRKIRFSTLKLIVVALYIVGNSWGIWNVMNHTDTTRGTWNTPYSEMIEFMKNYDPEKYVILSHNPVFDYHVKRFSFKVIDALGDSEWHDKIREHKGAVIVLKTYKGSLSDSGYALFNEYINSRKIIHSEKFGRDKYADFKRRFDAGYPDYYAEILITE